MGFEPGNQAAKGANHQRRQLITQKLIARLNDTDGAALDRVVAAIITKACEGDVPALKEIFDRVDGKVSQPIAQDGEFVISWQSKGS